MDNYNTLTVAIDPYGRLNNKTLTEPAPTVMFWKTKEYDIENVKHLVSFLKTLPKSHMIIDSQLKEQTGEKVRLSGEYFNNQSNWLVLDMEKSDTLSAIKSKKDQLSEKKVKKIIRKILGFAGDYVLVSSSRWELKGEMGWHIYIALDGWIDRSKLFTWLEIKLNESGNLYYGVSFKDKEGEPKSPIKYKRSDIIDITIYSTGRKIYEAQQIEPIEGRRKIIKLIKGDGSKLKTRTVINTSNSYKKEIVYKMTKEVKKRLKLLNKIGVKHYGKREWKKKKEDAAKGFYAPTHELFVKGKGVMTVQQIVSAGENIRYEGDSDSKGDASGAYYANSGLFEDFRANTRHRILEPIEGQLSIIEHDILGKYLDSSLIHNSKGIKLILSPTGSGKTYFIRLLKGTKIIIVPTRALGENIHDPENGVYYYQAQEHDNFKGYVAEVMIGETTVCTYDKFLSLALTLSDDILIFVDEAQNLFKDFRADTFAKLEHVLKKFKSITYLSATLHHKYIPKLDEVIKFKHKKVLDVTIVRNSDMKRRILETEGLHVVFKEDSYKNTIAQTVHGGFNVYSNHTDDIADNFITDDIKHIWCTSVMAEGVSLYVSEGRPVYVHITEVACVSDVIQMASRIRDAEVQVIIHTTNGYAEEGLQKEVTFNMDYLRTETEDRLKLWLEKNLIKVKGNRAIFKKFQNKFSKAINLDDKNYSMFNVIGSIKSYSDYIEKNYLENFVKGFEYFCNVDVKVTTDVVKTSVFNQLERTYFESIREMQSHLFSSDEVIKSLPRSKQKQLERFSKIKDRSQLKDDEIVEISKSDKLLTTYNRHVLLHETGAYKILNKSRLYQRIKVGDCLSDRQMLNLVLHIQTYSKSLRMLKKIKNAIDVINEFMQVTELGIVISKQLYEAPP